MSPVVVDAAGGQLRRLRATACAVTCGRAETGHGARDGPAVLRVVRSRYGTDGAQSLSFRRARPSGIARFARLSPAGIVRLKGYPFPMAAQAPGTAGLRSTPTMVGAFPSGPTQRVSATARRMIARSPASFAVSSAVSQRHVTGIVTTASAASTRSSEEYRSSPDRRDTGRWRTQGRWTFHCARTGWRHRAPEAPQVPGSDRRSPTRPTRWVPRTAAATATAEMV